MRRQMNLQHYGHSRHHSVEGNKYEEREQESHLAFQVTKDICDKLMVKITFLCIRLNAMVNKSIQKLIDQVQGNDEVKRKVFEALKQLSFERAEENKVAKQACRHMQKWKMLMAFKSWQHIKQYEAKYKEKADMAIEIMQKRRKFKMFHYLKIGVVYNRIGYLDYQIVNMVHHSSMKYKVLIEW